MSTALTTPTASHPLAAGTLEPWRVVWRDGIAPLLSTTALTAVRTALRDDDTRLQQGSTTDPPPLMCVQDWPCQGACLLGYAGWQGEGLATVGEVEEYFAAKCFQTNESLAPNGDPVIRYFLCWFDDTPRDEMRREMLAEVELALATRGLPAPQPV